MGTERLLASKHSSLLWRRPAEAITDKGLQCLWGQFGMRASPYTPPSGKDIQTVGNNAKITEEFGVFQNRKIWMSIIKLWENMAKIFLNFGNSSQLTILTLTKTVFHKEKIAFRKHNENLTTYYSPSSTVLCKNKFQTPIFHFYKKSHLCSLKNDFVGQNAV